MNLVPSLECNLGLRGSPHALALASEAFHPMVWVSFLKLYSVPTP